MIGFLYEGQCDTCETKWTMVAEKDNPSHPSMFVFDCPIPICQGEVDVHLQERRENGATSEV